MNAREDNEDFDTDRTAYIAFFSSAIAGFQPQQTKYKSTSAYVADVGAFAQAVADDAFARYKTTEAGGFPFDELDEDEDDEDEDDEEDERPARRRRRA